MTETKARPMTMKEILSVQRRRAQELVAVALKAARLPQTEFTALFQLQLEEAQQLEKQIERAWKTA